MISGFWLAGHWFALELGNVVLSDLFTFAKGVNSGYVPLGGVAINPGIAATFADRPYPGGLIYSSHLLASAAAVATIRVMEDEVSSSTLPCSAKRRSRRSFVSSREA